MSLGSIVKKATGVAKGVAGGLLGGGGAAASGGGSGSAPAAQKNEALINMLATQEMAKQQAMSQSQMANAQSMQPPTVGAMPGQAMPGAMPGAMPAPAAAPTVDPTYDANARLAETLKALRGY